MPPGQARRERRGSCYRSGTLACGRWRGGVARPWTCPWVHPAVHAPPPWLLACPIQESHRPRPPPIQAKCQKANIQKRWFFMQEVTVSLTTLWQSDPIISEAGGQLRGSAVRWRPLGRGNRRRGTHRAPAEGVAAEVGSIRGALLQSFPRQGAQGSCRGGRGANGISRTTSRFISAREGDDLHEGILVTRHGVLKVELQPSEKQALYPMAASPE